jgi:predicted DNA binding protein
MQIVNLVVRHDCQFSRPVAQGSHLRVTHLCHRGEEATLEVHSLDAEELRRLVRDYEAIGGTVIYREPDQSAALVRFASCACCASGRVIPSIESQGYLYLPPSAYSSEGESYQFLVEEERIAGRLLKSLPSDVETLRVGTKPLSALDFESGFLVPVGSLFRSLTPRQRQALLIGILRGYYRIPRAVMTEELARSLGISRPAFEALLRKAENKLVTTLFPYLTVQGTVPLPDDALTQSQPLAGK